MPATAIHIHPQYNTNTAAWDAAIVEVATPLTGDPVYVVQPGHEQLFRAGTNVTITGWGSVEFDGAYPVRLRKVTVPITSCEAETGAKRPRSTSTTAA